jgi:hypothetical protein
LRGAWSFTATVIVPTAIEAYRIARVVAGGSPLASAPWPGLASATE